MATVVDVSELRESVERWANEGGGQGLEIMRQRVHDRLPFGVSESDNPGPHLAETEEATVVSEGETWQGTLAYTAEHASFLDEGTGPHEITGNPLLAFQWGGQTVIVHSVMHPGSTIHKGWFSDFVTDDEWADAVTQALDSLGSPA